MSAHRYPIGRFTAPSTITPEDRAGLIEVIAAVPAALRAAVGGLNEAQFDTPYREGRWTLRQVIHHVPDSHFNAYCRFKPALTEDAPTIKPYDEARWAELPDSGGPVGPSLHLLEALHARWVSLLRALPEEAWGREFFYPQQGRPLRLDSATAMYAWHGRHHLAHVVGTVEREGWQREGYAEPAAAD